MVLAIVLGDKAEEAFRQSLLGSQGGLGIFFSNGLVGTIMALGLIALFWPLISERLDAACVSPQPPEVNANRIDLECSKVLDMELCIPASEASDRSGGAPMSDTPSAAAETAARIVLAPLERHLDLRGPRLHGAEGHHRLAQRL